jgi:hypothetical protein
MTSPAASLVFSISAFNGPNNPSNLLIRILQSKPFDRTTDRRPIEQIAIVAIAKSPRGNNSLLRIVSTEALSTDQNIDYIEPRSILNRASSPYNTEHPIARSNQLLHHCSVSFFSYFSSSLFSRLLFPCFAPFLLKNCSRFASYIAISLFGYL